MEIKDSVVNYFKTKASSTLLVSFSIFYVITHIEGFYTTLFVSQDFIFDKYQLLKNEYVFRYFFGFHFDSLEWWIRTISPFLLTYFYVWWLPKIVVNPGYKMETKYKVDRKIIKVEEEKRLLNIENDKIKQESKNTEAKIELESKKKRLEKVTPISEIEKEYKQFVKKQVNMDALADLRNLIYDNNGYLGGAKFYGSNSLMILDVNNLIKINEKNSNYRVITDKGKEFLRLYSNEKM